MAAPILFLVWFFVLTNDAQAVGQPDHLWHFDECWGSILGDSVGQDNLTSGAQWVLGRWGCGAHQPYQAQYQINQVFQEAWPAGELTLSFYWRDPSASLNGRNRIFFKKADGSVAAGLVLSSPGGSVSGDGWTVGGVATLPRNNDWHLITISYGHDGLSYYLNGVRKWFWAGDYAINQPITALEIRGENGPVEMDELAVWRRALSFEEAVAIYNANEPLSPQIQRPAQAEPRLAHLWHCDESAGNTAANSIGATPLSPIHTWAPGRFNSGFYQSWQANLFLINQTLDAPLDSPDVSVSFWWQNISYPNEGRGSLELYNNEGARVLGLRFSAYASSIYLGSQVIGVGKIFPDDGLWHQVTVSYDSYAYTLLVYVDGVEKIRRQAIRFQGPITRLIIRGENYSYRLDEIALWNGALHADQVQDDYAAEQPWQSFMVDPVIVVPGILGSWQIGKEWKLDPIFHVYDNLLEALMAAGYKEDGPFEDKPNLFVFPYDWRQDNNLTAQLLKEKIQQVKDSTGKTKVDIIAHSMGGLVARSYIQGNGYRNDVDQVVFLGTPHLGSPESYLKYEGGSFAKSNAWLLEYYFQIEAAVNGYGNLVDYIKDKVPTVRQLLPVYDYLQEKQAADWQFRMYPHGYPSNDYLASLNTEVGIADLKQRVNITNIVADSGSDSTLAVIKVVPATDGSGNRWLDGYPENLDGSQSGLVYGAGDGTVPLSSADGLRGVQVVQSQFATHKNLPTLMQKEVIEALTGQTPVDYFAETVLSAAKRWLFLRVYSPVDLAVTTPDGRRVGKNFADNTTINEIPNAFYSGFDGQAEFILIPEPTDGQYRLVVQGVDGGGHYRVAGSDINNDIEQSVVYSGMAPDNEFREFTVNYAVDNSMPMGELEPVDTTPPAIVWFAPTDGQRLTRASGIMPEFTVSDDFSGVASTSLSLDGRQLNGADWDLLSLVLGEHLLILTAWDQVGNSSQISLFFELTADFDSMVSDVNELADRGWLSGKIYKNVLTTALRLIKLEDNYLAKEQLLAERLLLKTGQDSKLNVKQKQRAVEQYEKNLKTAQQKRFKTLNRNLDLLTTMLDRYKKQNKLNQVGYDIMVNNISYLRDNL